VAGASAKEVIKGEMRRGKRKEKKEERKGERTKKRY
jgi:hypothetical protein